MICYSCTHRRRLKVKCPLNCRNSIVNYKLRTSKLKCLFNCIHNICNNMLFFTNKNTLKFKCHELPWGYQLGPLWGSVPNPKISEEPLENFFTHIRSLPCSRPILSQPLKLVFTSWSILRHRRPFLPQYITLTRRWSVFSLSYPSDAKSPSW